MEEIKLTEDHPSFNKRFKRYGVAYVDIRRNKKNIDERLIEHARSVVDNSPQIMYERFKEAWILKTEEAFYNKNFIFKVFEIDVRTYHIEKFVKLIYFKDEVNA